MLVHAMREMNVARAGTPLNALNTAYAFFERNWNLTRRYFGWEVVWLVYSLVSALTILFIAAATERITGQSVDTAYFVLYLFIGTTIVIHLVASLALVVESISRARCA